VAKDSDRANIHGKIILNWYLSVAVYMVGWLLVNLIVTFLSFIIIEVTGLYWIVGIVTSIPTLCLLVFTVLLIIFSIITAVKATNGKIWKYPFSLPFFFHVNVPKK
jgi:uncharacterized Tic20 family protein